MLNLVSKFKGECLRLDNHSAKGMPFETNNPQMVSLIDIKHQRWLLTASPLHEPAAQAQATAQTAASHTMHPVWLTDANAYQHHQQLPTIMIKMHA